MEGRPATRKRWPNGVTTTPFFHKNIDKGTPDWIDRQEITHKDRTIVYPMIDNPAYGALDNMAIAAIVLIVILLLVRYAKGFVANIAVLLGIVFGCVVAVAMGKMGFDKVVISQRTWSRFKPAQQKMMQDLFFEMEATKWYPVLKQRLDGDYKKWEEIMGAGTVVSLSESDLRKLTQPTAERQRPAGGTKEGTWPVARSLG